ncbi:unnamed protein product [Acanthoscelides obtectus]|uniref:U3 small nucleolar RNA-associated protein 14 homolog A n=1 Tax=Acanthoscelides obtectus TaxID=200917 RepID=A0A9P0P629_ACAOB|nr:unnamed protein product [Acanthoscelides obtectus]CAK1664279.1 U3 small nucleolar RNA-associated protein 14 homolog A [Acanthoscelides obtectus]
MSDSEDFEVSEDEIEENKHDRLVQDVLNLNKVQNVKKPSRTEPTLKISEFNLVKSVTGNRGTIHLNELTKALAGRKKHETIAQRVETTSKKGKTLPKPLEKPQAERIRRTLNYEKTRLQLDRWEAFVASNRAAAQQVFPLECIEKVKFEEKKAEKFPTTFRIKTDLQKKLELLDPKVEEYHINTEEKDEYPLTLQELKEKRKEAAKLRAHQSFQEAKARRQNKIKSKKYHRILRREKIKQKLKEFEELQKTNPEEAMKKLEDIDKARAEERFSLRHKNTGQWARSKLVRAKYDKETRQVLAQQLAISRDLTQKINDESDADEENISQANEEVHITSDSENPWMGNLKPNKEVLDFVSGYKKYWSEKGNEPQCNTVEQVTESSQKIAMDGVSEIDMEDNKIEGFTENSEEVITNGANEEVKENETEDKFTNKRKRKSPLQQQDAKKNSKEKITRVGLKNRKLDRVNIASIEVSKDKNLQKIIQKLDVSSTSEWDVEDAFEILEENIKKKVNKKAKQIKNISTKKTKKGTSLKQKVKKVDLSMPSKSKKHVIDEEMLETPGSMEPADEDPTVTSGMDQLKQIIDVTNVNTEVNVNPEKFLNVKTTRLDTAIPDFATTDENEEEAVAGQKELIMEAFEDDDVAAEFEKEKAEEIDKNKPKDIDLNLPGWGSWAGANIDSSKRKRRRFIIKMPPEIPRKDSNKGALIINEKAEKKIKPLLVSEVPFPFKSVKDYEASIRAPIGNNWVPETAFRRFIEPPVITKMGAIIEPISKSILVGQKKVY